MSHPALPPRVSRPWVLGAAAVWCVIALLARPAIQPIPAGRFEGSVILTTDRFEGPYGPWAMGTVQGTTVLLEFESDPIGRRGDELEISGLLEGQPGVAAGRPYASVLDVRAVSEVEPSRFVPHRAGRLVRSAVIDRLRPFDEGRALLSGFLIGDTSHIAESDVDAMRRSGLAHFVAVSGSNVALFLGLLAIAAGPLALGPRRRALIGLIGLPVYAAATGFEPSVMRASVMAGLVLGGRLVGIVLEAWQLLSLAVASLLLFDPSLTSNVGFQLSVAATGGVLMGARWPVAGWLRRSLTVTIGAQLAVAPLLILHFGSVPLLSPLVNLAAAPLVTMSTLGGALGVAVLPPLIGPAAWLAGLVMELARGAAAWPQLGALGLAGMVGAAVAFVLLRGLRPLLAVCCAVTLVLTLVLPRSSLPIAGVAVLDVGQGDAILLHGGGGRFALVDGGPDHGLLMDRLQHYGVDSIELVVLTHVHADHATGLIGLTRRVTIGEVWVANEPHQTSASEAFLEEVGSAGVAVHTPAPGYRRSLGKLRIDVEGPIRRYVSPNDQSIVLMVSGPARSILLSGDIETFAQNDLDHLRASVLKVPHQGAATSDPDWLSDVSAEVAVISVGPNGYGHPAQWVIDVLEESGATVRRTDLEGDVRIDLSND